jgi:hypothetical protein
MTAYDQGELAFLEGLDIIDNPFPIGTSESIDWDEGYSNALATSYEMW